MLKEFRALADAMPNEGANWKHRETTADGIKIYMMTVDGDPLYTFGGIVECDFPVREVLMIWYAAHLRRSHSGTWSVDDMVRSTPLVARPSATFR